MMVNPMKRYIIVILSVLLLTGSLFSVSLAWFTYIKRKSVATFVSNEILVDLEVNDAIFIDDYLLSDLAFVDFQNDFIEDQYGLIDSLASSIIINIELSNNSPLSRHFIQIQELSTEGLLLLVMYEGLDLTSEHVFESSYHALLMTILSEYATKQEMIEALELYNAAVLEGLSTILIYPGSVMTIQIAVWGDYDGLIEKDGYLSDTYHMDIAIESINARGVS